MNKILSEAQTRALQYWFVDGLAELAGGVIGLLLAVLFWVWQEIFTWRWSLLVILLAGSAVSFGLRLIIQRVKERSTFPRTGYAAPLSGLESRPLVFSLVAFTLILLGVNYFLSTRGPDGLLWSPAAAGLVFAFIFAWTGALAKLRRLYFLALFSLCGGVALAVLRLDYMHAIGILAGGVGLVLLVQGYRARNVYFRQNALPDDAVHG